MTDRQAPAGGRSPLLRVAVAGDSMRPTLVDGDWLLCRRVRGTSGVREGDVVVLERPDRPGLLVVKRAVRREAGAWWVEGDNAAASEDSRAFGAVPDAYVVARVTARYWPHPSRVTGPTGARPSWWISAVPGSGRRVTLARQPDSDARPRHTPGLDRTPSRLPTTKDASVHSSEVPADPPDRFAALDEDPAFPLHVRGKIEMRPTVRVRDNAGLALAYTPGVGRVSQALAADPSLAWRYTWKANSILIVTDGTAVLGLGDIGPVAALPVMEGKSLLFKEFGNIDCVPICLGTTDVGEIVDTVARIAPAYGGINLEDISAPRCFEIERRLQERLDIPVFHDDQHGTAVVVTAALTNAARVTGRALRDMRVVMSGAGAAGIAIANMLLAAGIGDVALCDRTGVIGRHRAGLTDVKADLAERTNSLGLQGSLFDALYGADVFIGVSSGTVPEEVVSTMAAQAIVFALANPDPEVHPDVAKAAGAAVIATGRSDFPNQINNVLAFPGIFRGALDSGATRITEGMKLAAAMAIAGLVEDDLGPENIVPDPFDPRLAATVAHAVGVAAVHDGVVRGG